MDGSYDFDDFPKAFPVWIRIDPESPSVEEPVAIVIRPLAPSMPPRGVMIPISARIDANIYTCENQI